MNSYWLYFVVYLVSSVVALVATPVVKLVALKCGRLDTPSIRKVHQQPMVRLGGAAIFGATLLSLCFVWGIGGLSELLRSDLQMMEALLIGGCGFFAIGFADDLLEMSAVQRLWMQGLTASIVWCLGIRIELVALPGFSYLSAYFSGLMPIEQTDLLWLSLPVTVLWLAGVVNAINWMDGLDGLAVGVAGIATCVLVVLSVGLGQSAPALASVALLGGLFGFWCYNYHPAEIFMGDGGSYFIGFMLAGLCVVESQSAAEISTLLPLVILALPLGDMVSVIGVRLFGGKSPFCADNQHLHHRLLRMGFSQRDAVWMMYCLCLLAGSVAFLIVGQGDHGLYMAAVVTLAVALWILSQLWPTERTTERTKAASK